jgi:phosphatidylglycerol:prolipoprotein diacylglycerol transferase
LHPILIDLGPLELPTYGALLAGAFLLALWLLGRLAGQEGIARDDVAGLWVWFLLAGLLGAKVTLYLVDWQYYWQNPAAILSGWRSAGVYYGGFVAAALAGVIYLRRTGLPLGPVADIVAPALALGQSVGRWGCLAAGCCYGKPSSLPWAVTFTDERARQITGVPLHRSLHPSQIYLSLNALLLCGVLLLLLQLKRRKGWPNGVVFWSYVLLYGATRFFLEYFRDDPRGKLGSLSTSQALGVLAVAASMVALSVLALGRRRAASGE